MKKTILILGIVLSFLIGKAQDSITVQYRSCDTCAYEDLVIYDTTPIFVQTTPLTDVQLDSLAKLTYYFLGDSLSAVFVNSIVHPPVRLRTKGLDYWTPVVGGITMIQNMVSDARRKECEKGLYQMSIMEFWFMAQSGQQVITERQKIVKYLSEDIDYNNTGLDYAVDDDIKVGFDYSDYSERSGTIVRIDTSSSPKWNTLFDGIDTKTTNIFTQKK